MLPKNARVRAVRPGFALDCVVFDASRARERQFRDVDGLAAEALHTLAFFLAATSRNRCRLSGDVANRRAMSLLANRQPANRSPAQKARPRDPLARKLPPSQPRPRKRPRVRGAFNLRLFRFPDFYAAAVHGFAADGRVVDVGVCDHRVARAFGRQPLSVVVGSVLR